MNGFTSEPPQTARAGAQAPLFDRAQALGRVGGDLELLKEIAQLFLDESGGMMAAIDQALAARDAKALERSAHTLKGCVSNFENGICFDAALALEQAGRSERFEDTDGCYRDLTAALDRLRPELVDLASE